MAKPRKKMRLEDYKARYDAWWLGKTVAYPFGSNAIIGKVIGIEVIGPPSGVYHFAYLTIEGRENTFNLPRDSVAFKPAKKDLLVVD